MSRRAGSAGLLGRGLPGHHGCNQGPPRTAAPTAPCSALSMPLPTFGRALGIAGVTVKTLLTRASPCLVGLGADCCHHWVLVDLVHLGDTCLDCGGCTELLGETDVQNLQAERRPVSRPEARLREATGFLLSSPQGTVTGPGPLGEGREWWGSPTLVPLELTL